MLSNRLPIIIVSPGELQEDSAGDVLPALWLQCYLLSEELDLLLFCMSSKICWLSYYSTLLLSILHARKQFTERWWNQL